MAQQQSFPSTVRKQIHSVYTIIQLLIQLSNVCLDKGDCSLLSRCDDCLS